MKHHNLNGAPVRCKQCKRMTRSIKPCKACGSIRHIVAIETYHWRDKDVTIEQAMGKARLKVLRTWKAQAGLKARGRVPYIAEIDDCETQRATLVFDLDGDYITVTFYYREVAMRYPA